MAVWLMPGDMMRTASACLPASRSAIAMTAPACSGLVHAAGPITPFDAYQ